ncbi:carbohydrate-binding WSC [Xylaria acuta]|nr:carbohydrate-binding WSC [Xylaria acuta]
MPHVPWIGLGCYAQQNPKLLVYPTFPSYYTTHESCIGQCSALGYLYVGLEDGSDCSCGPEIKKPGKLAPDGAGGCNVTCTGNPDQICGGKSRVKILL